MMNYAYVTFIIKNDSYVPGALVFAYSLRKQNTKHDLICFVTDDISAEAIASLKLLYDYVINTNQIIVENKRKQSRQDVTYLFNRFQALLLYDGSINGKSYDKIIIADSDLIAIQKWDDLFDIDAPAGVINESKLNCMEYDESGKFIIPKSYYDNQTWIWHTIYNEVCPQGALIPRDITDRVNQDVDNMGVNSAIYLLQPSLKLYESIQNDLENEMILQQISEYNWPEMQYLTYKLSGKWHNIDIRYASVGGYPTLEYLNGIHFAGLKPWSFKNKSINVFGRYDDFKLWYLLYKNMMNDYKKMFENKKLKKLYDKIVVFTTKDKYIYNKQYNNINVLLK